MVEKVTVGYYEKIGKKSVFTEQQITLENINKFSTSPKK